MVIDGAPSYSLNSHVFIITSAVLQPMSLSLPLLTLWRNLKVSSIGGRSKIHEGIEDRALGCLPSEEVDNGGISLWLPQLKPDTSNLRIKSMLEENFAGSGRTHIGAPYVVYHLADFSGALVHGIFKPRPKLGHPIEVSIFRNAVGTLRFSLTK